MKAVHSSFVTGGHTRGKKGRNFTTSIWFYFSCWYPKTEKRSHVTRVSSSSSSLDGSKKFEAGVITRDEETGPLLVAFPYAHSTPNNFAVLHAMNGAENSTAALYHAQQLAARRQPAIEHHQMPSSDVFTADGVARRKIVTPTTPRASSVPSTMTCGSGRHMSHSMR